MMSLHSRAATSRSESEADRIAARWGFDQAWNPAEARAEGARLLEDDSHDDRLRAWGHALLAIGEADDVVAASGLLRASDLFRSAGDREGLVLILIRLSELWTGNGNPADAVGLADEAIEIAKETSRPALAARALVALARRQLVAGDPESATEHLIEALEIGRELGDIPLEASVLADLGAACVDAGEFDEAERWFGSGASLANVAGNHAAEYAALAQLTGVHLTRGETDSARSVSTRATELAIQLGETRGMLALRFARGELELAENDTQAAIATIRGGLDEIDPAVNPELWLQGALAYAEAAVVEPVVRHEAIGLLERAPHLGGRTSLLEIERQRALGNLYLAEGDDRAAAGAFGKLVELTDLHVGDQLRRSRHYQRAENAYLASALDQARESESVAKALAATASQQLRALQELTDRLASEDPLTGLYTRRYLYDHLEREILRSARSGETLSFLLMDLDRFKQINDRFGHETGDAVLKACAEIIKNALRAEDVIARFGGEEFAVVLPQVGEETAQMLAERIRTAVATYPWHAIEPDLHVTISAGVADFANAATMDDVVSQADALLYQAKSNGRNRVCARLDANVETVA